MSTHPTRREFVSSSASLLSSGWLALQLPVLTSLAACAPDAARRGDPFVTFTASEGRAMQAFAARIIPSDDGTPGADEAGAAWFADAALGGPLEGMSPPIREGLADLDKRAQAAHKRDFAQLDAAQQDAIITAVQDTPFFELGRMVVVIGTFSEPSHGGNREHVGFTLLKMDHAPVYQPPFGHYDAEYAKNGGVA